MLPHVSLGTGAFVEEPRPVSSSMSDLTWAADGLRQEKFQVNDGVGLNKKKWSS